jgi:aarF domain-containing kinase
MEYCQGMNFLAGFLVLITKDQALSFALLRGLVNKYDMSEIFNADKSKLKLFFYTLDRLISIYLPDLHSHFKEESVNSSMFCTTFFITLFTQVLQTQQTPEKIWKLKRIWDYFIVYGWKAIFKVSVLMLRESEENLF